MATIALLAGASAARATAVTNSDNEVGISYERAVQHFPGLVREEVFLRFPLSWQHDISQNYRLKSFVVLAAGDMGRDNHDPTLVSLGVQLRVDPRRSAGRMYYLAGFSPTPLANTTFGHTTMGTALEFTTQLAVGVYLGRTRRAAVEFSIQHTSNGGLSSHNPGVNTLGLAVVYRF